MIRKPGFNVDEIRGRLLYESLLKEAEEQFGVWSTGAPVTMPPPTEPPVFPTLARTDTGTLHAVVIAG